MSKRLLWTVVGLVGSVALVLFLYSVATLPKRLMKRATEKQERVVDLTALVTQIRDLSRLETASMRIIHVSSVSQSYGIIPDAISGDELTFMAVGDVIGGIDLSTIKSTDVRIDSEGTLILRLPPAQILVTRLDSQKSRILTRKTGFFRQADVHMETRARANAERAVRGEAIRKGILQLSDEGGEKKLGEFLHTVGFQKVRFERIQPQPARL